MIDLTRALEEWHETCALDRCSPKNIHDLCIVSNHMFKKAQEKLPEGVHSLEKFSRIECESDFRYTFHLMEAELLPMGTMEERRAFKDRIFSRVKDAGCVSGYLFRDFFRSFIKKRSNSSYGHPEKPEEYTDAEWEEKIVFKEVNRDESLYDPASLLDKTALKKQSKQDAPVFWNSLNPVDQAALYVYLNDITMSDSSILSIVGRGKSVFTPKRVEKILQSVLDDLPEMEPCDKRDYMDCFISTIKECFPKWEKESEMGQSIDSFLHSQGETV